MSFPRYPKYKPSGVEWLGDVPEGWEVKPLRSVFKFSKGLTITKEDLRDEGVPCVNYGEIHSKYGFRLNPLVHPLRCVDSEYLLTNPDALIRDGDFVFADTSEDLEGSGNFTHLRADTPIFAGYHTIIGRPRKGTNSLLLAYQIHSSAFRSQIQKQVKGVKVFSISQGILKGAKCLLPPLADQTAIAEFLDRETGRIDELVAEQRRLMELLKEKRQAVISHAVTQGLNPHAPMKPSGIEWLGDVPAGWTVKRFQRCVYVAEGQVDPRDDRFSEMVLIAPNHIESGTGRLLELETARDQGADSGKYMVKAGDVVYSKIRPALRKVCIAPDNCLCSADMYPLRAHSGLTNTFLFWLILSEQFSAFAELESQRVAMPKVNRESLKAVMLAVPAVTEQNEIVAFIEDQTTKFDTLTAEAQRAIDLLQERRTALISAAVTGQIDVRNHSPKL